MFSSFGTSLRFAGGVSRLAGGLSFVLAVASGCDRGHDVRFVDGSAGLPRTGEWRQRIAVADLDGDRQPEIIAPAARREAKPRPHIWSRDAKGTWKEWPNGFPEAGFGYGDVSVADFDRDGRPDLAFAFHGIGVSVFLSREGGKWLAMGRGLPKQGEFPTRAVAAGDLNGDGWPDLVALAEMTSRSAEGPTGARAFFNREGAGFQEEKIGGAEEIFGDRVRVGLVAAGGEPAMIVGSLVYGYSDLVWSRGRDDWSSASEGLPKNLVFWDLALCDVDADGKQELFVAGDAPRSEKSAGPRVFSLEGKVWRELSDGLPRMAVRGIAAGDLDRRPGCELAVADIFQQKVSIFRRGKNGAWSEWMSLAKDPAIGGYAYAVTAADADGDGALDLLVNYSADPDQGGIQLWLNRAS